jgi:hypothetical protein
MTGSGVATGLAMATSPFHLAQTMAPLAPKFPEIHTDLVLALGHLMRADGVMEFTVSGLAKDAGVRPGLTKEFLKAARDDGLLHVLGRRTDNGMIRYCAYRETPADESLPQ